MLLLSKGYCIFQSLQFIRDYFSKKEIALLWLVQCHKHEEGYFRSSKKILCSFKTVKSELLHLSKHSSISNIRSDEVAIPSGLPSVSTVQPCICSDVMANGLDALLSSRRIQRSSSSVRTTWQYRSDAIQCLTRKRISFRDRYGKTATSVRTLGIHSPDAVPDKARRGAEVQTFGRPSPYYGNNVQQKCNRLDARATPSRRFPIQERILANLESPLLSCLSGRRLEKIVSDSV
jgi:hypothetical protein